MSIPADFSPVVALRPRRSLLLACAVLLSLALSASAQPPERREDRKPTNLKVLDSTMTHDQVIAVMRKFSHALGVDCEHCHAARKPGEQHMDFASDENKIKETAREMIRMTKHINADYLSNLPATSDTIKVTAQCVTCHHGQPIPRLLQDVLKQALATGGMPAVDSTYRELRNEYYGSFTYNFSDNVLAGMALEMADDDATDATALLNLNKEFNPDSYINEYAFGLLYADQADTAAAIAAFKRALEIEPKFRPAQRQLQALGEK